VRGRTVWVLGRKEGCVMCVKGKQTSGVGDSCRSQQRNLHMREEALGIAKKMQHDEECRC
jgi:hypothetical protein